MKDIQISCYDCSAEYTVTCDMDETFYTPRYCLFCSYEFDEDDFSFIGEDNDEFP